MFEFIPDGILYNFGYWFLKIITFTKFPKKYNSVNGNIFIESVGFVVFVLILFSLVYLF